LLFPEICLNLTALFQNYKIKSKRLKKRNFVSICEIWKESIFDMIYSETHKDFVNEIRKNRDKFNEGLLEAVFELEHIAIQKSSADRKAEKKARQLKKI